MVLMERWSTQFLETIHWNMYSSVWGQTYNVEFILKDAELGKYSYKATFEGESLNEILRLLEMSAPIQCKEVSNRSNNSEKFEKQRIEVSKTMQ